MNFDVITCSTNESENLPTIFNSTTSLHLLRDSKSWQLFSYYYYYYYSEQLPSMTS